MAKAKRRAMKRGTSKTKQRPRVSHAKALRGVLESDPRRPHLPRTDIGSGAPRPSESLEMAEEAVGAAGSRTFVAAVSNNGPWELRSLVINDFQILRTTVATSDRRIDVPIPAVLGSPLRITWAILAAHLIPSAGTFVEEPGQAPKQLATKGPLKKGDSWAPLSPVTFP